VRLGQGGEVEKFNDNLRAIRTLKQIEAEGRRATPEEQAILARYVGWGGLANAFPDPLSGTFKEAWSKRGPELAALLTPKEHQMAGRSTLDSHYTSQTVVNSMWAAAARLGFKGGMALESSMGVGNFLGLIPEWLSANTKFVGVEYDSLTSRIAALLYPQATILNSGFQSVPLSDGSFDLSIGNPPFGNQSLRFQFKPELNAHSIHNQFFLASIDAVKPGGLQIQVVSRYLMDAVDTSARAALAKKAKLIGAIRLPDTAFKENARTEVVTDILFLQRLTAQEQAEMEAAFAAARQKKEKNYQAEQERQALADRVPSWVNSTKVPDPLGGEPMQISRYFADHPEMIMGTLERSGSMAHGNDITVRLDKGESLAGMLDAAISRLPEGVMRQEQSAIDASIARHQAMSDALHIAISGQEQGAITFDADGNLQQVFERETPNGDFELAKRTLSATSPWSPELYQNDKGQWYKIEAVLDEAGKPVKQQVKNSITGEVRSTNKNVYGRVVFEKESDIPSGLLLGAEKFKRLKALVGLRDLLSDQLSMEAEDAGAAQIEGNRKALKEAYQKFVKDSGYINEPANAALVANMPDGALVLALELQYRPAISAAKAARIGEKVRGASATPAPILSERVIMKYEPPTSAASHADALAIAMAESGRVDMDRIASLLGRPTEDISAEMLGADKPMVFKDPESGEIVDRNEYLSGQVKRKLEAARNAGLSKNVEALTAVQPEPWGAESVTALLGSTWVPPAVYEAFIAHISGGNPRVSFSRLTNSFTVTNASRIRANEEEWGTDDVASASIINDLLNSRAVKVTRTDSDGKTYVDQEATALALLKAKAISNEFSDWVFADSDRRNLLVDTFNEKFNTRVNRQHDGSHLLLPGKVPDMIIKMRRHQKNAIWRGISERFMLLDHIVGAGKSFTAIARAMERRRMGLSKKPAIIVPNHMVQQFTSDAYRLYPGAKVLAATKRDFEKKNRRKFFAKIATGDFDIVIIPHSSFGFIGISPETEARYLEQELEAAEAAIKDAQAAADKEGGGGYRKPFGVKEAERLRDKITARMDKIRGADSKDRLLTFEQMGIDDLTVDEAHEFKNLFYSSRLTNVMGMGNKEGSQKAFDLYNKVRVLRDSPKGTVTFMTGTPISNSAVEMYTMMRFLAAKELDELGLSHFDAWRAQFVSTDADWEQNETGRLKEVNRLGRTWSNMRSLMDLYYSFTDSVSNDDIKSAYAEDNNGAQFPIPKVKDGDRQSVVVQPTEAQLSLLNHIIEEFDALPSINDPRERNIRRLKLRDRARKVSLDVRAADPTNPSDEQGGKLDKLAAEVHRIYQKWDKDLGTQLIFLDRSVPKAKGDDKTLKEYDALLAEQGKALADGDEDGLRRVGEKLEKYDSNEMAEMRSAQAGGWNAYQQIKDNLMALGIPSSEIRFIQEANNDAQKQAMFDAVNDGSVRVLIGSTPRMGAGTNVQQRLVALHHGDVTWKPSDIEQREGRIIRQGNMLLDKYGIDKFEVEILAYATEHTIDAKMWSLNSSKLKTINGIRKYDGAFSMEFEDAESVSMAELAALASGDPLLLERVKLMSEIDNLNLLKRQHARKEWGIISQIESAEKAIARIPAAISAMETDIERLRAAHAAVEAKVAAREIDIEGKTYSTPESAKLAAHAAQQAQQNGDDNAKFSISVNGRRKSTQNTYLDEISHVFGDTKPFEMVVNDEPYIGRTDAARLLAEKSSEIAGALGKGGEESIKMGTYMGFPLELTVGRSSHFDAFYATLSLLREDGSTLASADTSGIETSRFSTQALRPLLTRLDGDIDVDNKLRQISDSRRRLAAAQAELPELLAKKGAPFPKAEELDAKNARLEEVIRALSGDKADSAAAASGAVFSRGANMGGSPIGQDVNRTAVTEAEVRRVVDRILGTMPNANLPNFHIFDTFDALPAAVIDQAIKEGAKGTVDAVRNENGILLVRDRFTSTEHLEKAIFHELAHEGLRKLFGSDFVAKMNQLFLAVGGESGLRRIAAKHNISLDAYFKGFESNKEAYTPDERRATLTEELLAYIAEERPTLKSKVLEIVGMVRNWLREHGFSALPSGTNADILDILRRSRKALGAPQSVGGRLSGNAFLENKLGELARAARASGNENQTVVLGKLSAAEVALLSREGVAVDDGYSHAADMFAVRHALNRHGDERVEKSRGQLAITDNDVAQIAEAIAAPTAYVLGGKTPRKQDVVGTIKRLADGTLLYLEEVRSGRKTLSMTSMRKYPGTTDFDTIANSVLPSNARSDTGDVRIVYPDGRESQPGKDGRNFDPANHDIRFRRSDPRGQLGSALATAANSIKDVRLPADYLVGDFLSSNGKLSWWHKTIGTQYNLAKRSPLYAKVYDRVQSFIGDVSQYAVEAADQAPNILPKLENLADIWQKQPLTPEDTKAVSAPIFEGTLIWSRDAHGRPIKLSELEDAASRMTTEQKKDVLLQKGVIDDDQVRRWQANPLDFYDAAINNRYEQSELRGGIVWTPSELQTMFGLNAKQIGLYQEFRAATDRSLTSLAISDMLKFGGKDAEAVTEEAMGANDVGRAGELLRDHFMRLAEDDPAREKSLMDTATAMIDKADRAQDLMDRGYAPLSRFGHYTVYVQNGGEQVYFGMFENKAEAAKMARKMRENYPDAQITHGTASEESYKLFAGVSPETVELFGSMLGLDSQGDGAASEAYQAYLKLAKNSRSAMKRLIERKGVAGFSEDAGRVLAGFVYSNARLTSSNLHMGELNDAINDIPKAQGELKDAAVQLAEHVKNPQGGGGMMGGLMFAQFLGGSVASALVNMTQPIAMTFPYLSQYGGIAQAAAQLTAAARDAGRASTGDAKLDAALKLAAEEGIVSPQEVHQLKAQAAGRGVLQAGDGTRLGDAAAKMNNALAKLSLGWGKLFALAELTNRRITFIAAYRVAEAQGMADPAAFAKDAIEATQGTYNAGNKPRWARSTLGGLAMTFKQYSIAYIELLGRMAFAGEPGSPERAAGRRGALLMLAVLFLMSGADGLPFEQDMEDVIDGILQRMGYNFSTKRKKEEFLTEVLGEGGADFALKGISGLPGVPIDVSGRFGLGNLIPATGLFTKKSSYTQDIGELAGPAGDIAKRAFTAAGKAVGGQFDDALIDLSPVALRNLEKGARMLQHGAYRDTRGYVVNETTPVEAVLKMAGFQPNSTAHIQGAKMQAIDMIEQNRMRSKEIQEHWAQGLANNDPDKVQEAREMRDDWNEKNPDTPIKVNMPAVIRRVKEMRLSAAERTNKTAPKALKSAVQRELAGG